MKVRLPRFAVATALLVVVVAWLQVGLPMYRQQPAIRAIRQAGGFVGVEPDGPEWNSDWTRFGQATVVGLTNKQFNDADAVCLATLKHAKVMVLLGTQITDVTLEHLKELTNLQYLDVRETRVTESGVAELQRALPDLDIVR
jgi:hypothetical protein